MRIAHGTWTLFSFSAHARKDKNIVINCTKNIPDIRESLVTVSQHLSEHPVHFYQFGYSVLAARNYIATPYKILTIEVDVITDRHQFFTLFIFQLAKKLVPFFSHNKPARHQKLNLNSYFGTAAFP